MSNTRRLVMRCGLVLSILLLILTVLKFHITNQVSLTGIESGTIWVFTLGFFAIGLQQNTKNATSVKSKIILATLLLLNISFDISHHYFREINQIPSNILIQYIIITGCIALLPRERHRIAAKASKIAKTYLKLKNKKIQQTIDSPSATWIWLTIIICLGIYLRLRHIGVQTLAFEDDFSTLAAAIQYNITGSFDYTRTPLLTRITAEAFTITGSNSLSVARIPLVIADVANIALIYFLAKTINRPTGLIAAYIWTILPIAIGHTHFVREYTLFTTILLASSLYYLWAIKHMARWKLTYFLLAIPMLAPLWYYMNNGSSTFVFVVLSLFTISGTYIVHTFTQKRGKQTQRKSDQKTKSYIRYSLGIIVGIATSIAIYQFAIFISPGLTITPNLSKWNTYLSLFLYSVPHTPEHAYTWFFNAGMTPSIIGILIFAPLWIWKKSPNLISFAAAFLVQLSTIAFFADRYFQTRYIFYAYPFYVILVSAGIVLLLRVINITNNTIIKAGLVLLVIVLINPVPTIKLTEPEPRPGFEQLTGLKRRDYSSTAKAASLATTNTDHCIVFASAAAYYYYHNQPTTHANTLLITPYNQDKDFTKTRKMINQCKHGQIFTTKNNQDFPITPDSASEISTSLKYSTTEEEYDIYKW